MPTYKIQVLNNFKPDWNQTDETQADYIKNKPTLGTLAEKDSEIYIGSGEMPDGYVLQIDPDGSAITIPTKTSQLENDSGFVTEGDLPTKISQFENDSGFITSDDLPEPELPAVATDDIGKILKVVSVNEDGTFTCEWVDGNSVNDVQINGETIVSDGVANIPTANQSRYGVMKQSSVYGTQLTNGILSPLAWKTYVDKRNNAFMSYGNLDYAVKAAMCDGKGDAWTEEEQAAARKRIGCADLSDMEDIITITMDADTLVYQFPSLNDYKILYFIITKTYKATTNLSGNCWFRFGTTTSGIYSMFPEARTEIFLDASMPTGITGMITAANNVQLSNYWKSICAVNAELDVSFRGTPTYTLANADIAAYHAECGTTIRVMGVRR